MAGFDFRRWLSNQVVEVELSGDDFFIPDLCGVQNLLFMVLVSELLAVVLVLFEDGIVGFSWSALGLTSLFVQWIVLTGAALLCNTRRYLKDLNIVAAISIAYGMILAVALIISVATEALLGGDVALGGEAWYRVWNRVLISAILTGLAFRYLYVQHQLRIQEQAELHSRIQALQSRIRPHFLFNSMNIIASLIEEDPISAERVVEDLSLLFRASLSESSNRPVTLQEEIALCEKYTGIEMLRLGDRLQVDWRIDADIERTEIPMLTLQPLLENAIYHGIQPLPDGGVVRVEIETSGDEVVIRVVNPLPREDPQHEAGNRMAVDNIRHRLRALYGPAANVETVRSAESFETIVHYPLPLPED